MRTMTNGMVALALASVGMIPMGHGVQGSATVRAGGPQGPRLLSRGARHRRGRRVRQSVPSRREALLQPRREVRPADERRVHRPGRGQAGR